MNAQASRMQAMRPRPIQSAQARVAAASSGKSPPQPAASVAAEQTLAASVTSPEPSCVLEAMSIEGVTALLLERGLGAVAVVNGDGRLVGMVSAADLLREGEEHGDGVEERVPLRTLSGSGIRTRLGAGFHATRLARGTAREIMTLAPAALAADASVADAAAVMARERVAELPIVGARGQFLDIISAIDVMRWMASVPAVVAREEQQCPACARMLLSLCGDSVAQQAWFRRIPHVGLCLAH